MERARVRNVNKAFWETFIIARQARTRYDDLISVRFQFQITLCPTIFLKPF